MISEPPTQIDRSPDGRFEVHYRHIDGEKTPLITEVRVLQPALGETLLDLWGWHLNGCVHGFDATGFRLRIEDPFSPTRLAYVIDAESRTFREDSPDAPARELAALAAFASAAINQGQLDYRKKFPPPLPVAEPRRSGLWNWLFG